MGTAAQETDNKGQPDQGTRDETKAQRPDEQLLTGADADKARAAALAKYPGATGPRK